MRSTHLLALLAWISIAGCAGPETPLASSSKAPAATSGPLSTAAIAQHIAAREYWAREGERGLQAPNRRHGLRTRFGPRGIRIEDRRDASVLAELRLAAWGRAGDLAKAEAGSVASDEARVELIRDGIVEWFENRPDGLEHGFTVAERPAGARALVFELAVAGAEAQLRDGAIQLHSSGGRTLDYAKLRVWDANRAELPSHFESPAPDRIRLVVADAGAAYPLMIDPIITDTDDGELEANTGDAAFGETVDSAGDVNGDGYDDVIVGAYKFDVDFVQRGAAFVFLGSATGIGDGGPLTAQAEILGDGFWFGRSISAAGDVNGDGYDDVMVGAEVFDDDQQDEGAVYVYLGSATGIVGTSPATAHARIVSNISSSRFGDAVAPAGDVNGDGYDDLLIAASILSSPEINEGVVFAFLGSASGIVDVDVSTAHAQFEGDRVGAGCGGSLASAGDINGDGYDDVIIGCRLYTNGEDDEGAAMVFLGSATGLTDGNPSTAHFAIESNEVDGNLGVSVAGAGDVNADGYDDILIGYDGFNSREGAVLIFLGSATGISGTTPLDADGQLESDDMGRTLGYRVASAGDVNDDGYDDIIATARFAPPAVYVWLGSAVGIPDGNFLTAIASVTTSQPTSSFGTGLASAGDVNADGFDDIIVGAPRANSGQTAEGVAFLYHGSIDLPEPSAWLGLVAGGALLCELRRRKARRV